MNKKDNMELATKRWAGILTIIIIVVLCGIVMYLSSDAQRLQRQLKLGQKYLSELDYEQAIIAFEKAIAIDSKNVEAYIGLSKAYGGMGTSEKSISLLETAYEVTEAEEIKTLLAQKKEEKREKEQHKKEEARKKDKKEEETDEQLKSSEKDAVKVDFERFYEDLYECTIITGKDDQGNIVWEYETKYEAADSDRVSEIGVRDGCYYFVEDGVITAMHLSDGTVKWKNDAFDGSSTASVFGDDGNLYICGYFGPDFFAVDKDGNTIKMIEQFDPDYYWPYEMEYLGDQVKVTFEGIPDSIDEKAIFYVNLADFTYYGEGSADADEVYETSDFVVKMSNSSDFPYSAHLSVTGHDGAVIGEATYSGDDEYTGYYGSVAIGDLTDDGKEEILVNAAYFGSNYGAADVYVYTIEENELVEILSLGTERVHEIYPEIWRGTGAAIEAGCLKINGLIEEDSWEKEYIDIRIKYQNREWVRAE